MYLKTDEELSKMGAVITTREIHQQPKLWQETLQIYQNNFEKISNFLNKFTVKFSKVRVIFTGAGTSAYVGNTITPYLNKNGDREKFNFEAIDTTKIVSAPLDYLEADTPTILISFARSGNSPESVAAVEIARKVIKNLFQIAITCAPEGKLALDFENDDNSLVLLMPEKSLDKGFAMTGSFSCMTLAALLIFDYQNSYEAKAKFVNYVSQLGQSVIEREEVISKLLTTDFNRIAYLGSGCLGGLTQEAQLKILELTAGKIATIFDTSMGFRHGPKSFLDQRTLVFDFISNDSYSRQYDVDILEEMKNDEIAPVVMGIGQKDDKLSFQGDNFYFESEIILPDAYLALADIMVAQTIALMSSIKVGNTPDTPSPTGTVNRVVKGVTIHKFE